jgi:hypothetical protein
MGPFLGQILQNISCTFDDATSTTTGNSGVASIDSKPSTIKKEAYTIYRDKLSSLENKQRQELQRFEQEIAESHEDVDDHKAQLNNHYYT